MERSNQIALFVKMLCVEHKTTVTPLAMEFLHSCTKPAICYGTKLYRKTSNISRTFVGDKIVDNSDVVGASPVGAAPTTSSFST